jgi:hypothetical protein
VVCDSERVAQRSPTVIFCFTPRVAEHWIYLYKRQCRAGVWRNGLAHGVYRSGRVIDSLCHGHGAKAFLDPARHGASE